VISQGQVVKCTLASGLIVDEHVVVEGFLVREMEIVLHVIRGPDRVARHILLTVIDNFCVAFRHHSYDTRAKWFQRQSFLVGVLLL